MRERNELNISLFDEALALSLRQHCRHSNKDRTTFGSPQRRSGPHWLSQLACYLLLLVAHLLPNCRVLSGRCVDACVRVSVHAEVQEALSSSLGLHLLIVTAYMKVYAHIFIESLFCSKPPLSLASDTASEISTCIMHILLTFTSTCSSDSGLMNHSRMLSVCWNSPEPKMNTSHQPDESSCWLSTLAGNKQSVGGPVPVLKKIFAWSNSWSGWWMYQPLWLVGKSQFPALFLTIFQLVFGLWATTFFHICFM